MPSLALRSTGAAMDKPTMGVEDLKRLILEMVLNDHPDPETINTWMEDQGIEEEAIEFFYEKMGQAFIMAVQDGDFEPHYALQATLCSCFQIGWEAHKEYGRKR
jgi:hypothetical protein